MQVKIQPQSYGHTYSAGSPPFTAIYLATESHLQPVLAVTIVAASPESHDQILATSMFMMIAVPPGSCDQQPSIYPENLSSNGSLSSFSVHRYVFLLLLMSTSL